MKYNILILIADALLSGSFVFQKLYQKGRKETLTDGLLYNTVFGAVGVITFFLISRFQIEFSVFSLIAAFLQASLITLYTIISFKILETGDLSLYTMFLMTGGMTLPYIFGIAFLNEKFTVIRSLGLILIGIAVIMINSSTQKTDKRRLVLCVLTFVINGATSIIAKTHQINTQFNPVDTQSFAFLMCFMRVILCGLLLLFVTPQTHKQSKSFSIKRLLLFTTVSSILWNISYILQLIGAKNLPATVLYPLITGGCIILTSLFGVLFLKEKLNTKQIISIVICFIGTLMFL